MSAEAARLDDAFWRFSLAAYARPGAAAACLAFQDEGGGDVNLLLLCLWTGREHGALAPAALGEAIALSQGWRERAVAPLRALRRDLKGGVSGFEAAAAELRSAVKALELAAEEAQQRRIAGLAAASTPPPGEAAASANVAAYLEHLRRGRDPETVEAAARSAARAQSATRADPL